MMLCTTLIVHASMGGSWKSNLPEVIENVSKSYFILYQPCMYFVHFIFVFPMTFIFISYQMSFNKNLWCALVEV